MKSTFIILAAGAGAAMAATNNNATTLQDVVVSHHKDARARHGVAPLTWNQELATIAQSHTNKCVWEHDRSTPFSGGTYGQNMYMTGDTRQSPIVAAGQGISDSWYAGELKEFNKLNLWGQASPDMSTFGKWGHFTQVAWNATTDVGCAYQKCNLQGTNSWFIVCNYAAAGNFAGQYDKNVFRPLPNATAISK